MSALVRSSCGLTGASTAVYDYPAAQSRRIILKLLQILLVHERTLFEVESVLVLYIQASPFLALIVSLSYQELLPTVYVVF